MGTLSINKILMALMATALVPASGAEAATTVFSDNFAKGAKPDWGNERGNWRAPLRTDAYDAANPNNNPLTYTSVTTQPNLNKFVVRVTVNDLNDGGVWLRSNWNGGNINGILLVTGGNTGSFNGFYWHVVSNGVPGPELQAVSVPGIQGTTVPIRIMVNGNTYKLYLGTSSTPISTLVDKTYKVGSVALYDFSPTSGASSPRGETFSKFSITVP